MIRAAVLMLLFLSPCFLTLACARTKIIQNALSLQPNHKFNCKNSNFPGKIFYFLAFKSLAVLVLASFVFTLELLLCCVVCVRFKL